MYEFEVDGHQYRAGKIPARTQHHLVRRLAPFASTFTVLKEPAKIQKDPSLLIGVMGEALAKMSDEDSDFIFDTCLRVVEYKQGESGWQKLHVGAGSNRLMFTDVETNLLSQYLIIGYVLQDSLGPFIDAVKRALMTLLPATSATSPQ